MKNFNAKHITDECISWIKLYAHEANMKRAIIGISGGKDSYVAAALCCEAIGRENVIGVIMPNGIMKDWEDAEYVCNDLDIMHFTVDISSAYNGVIDAIEHGVNRANSNGRYLSVSANAAINIAPRIRMTTLYALGQTLGCRVCGTGNLSEKTVGYFTKWGDGACDFNPLGNMTSDEVIEVGRQMGLSERILSKTPNDGLSGQSDEEKLGISYKDINEYITNADEFRLSNPDVYENIKRLELKSWHKNSPIPYYRFSRTM